MQKTIIRVEKRSNPYAMIDKGVLNDKRLSWRAKGLLAYLLSKPDDWRVNINDLVNQSKDGRDAVYATLQELEEAGYIVSRKVREKGRFLGVERIVRETPVSSIESSNPNTPEPEMTQTDLPYTEKPDTEKPDTESPQTEKPYPEKPEDTNNDLTKKRDLPKNDRTKRESKNTPPKVQFAEFVSMTNDEFSSLVAKLGEHRTRRAIEILDNYKGATGKTYKSDFRAMLNWVITRLEEEERKGTQGVSQARQPWLAAKGPLAGRNVMPQSSDEARQYERFNDI
ncbi:hypothetical protein GJ688_01930 [Heliobacillus mobilis]|uniref:Helix-turn-helix domain-containing protein n=1 Tax=Heliobacterium mobile TaxID=28064 RepID=A0A6I3SGD2_HELMO|nr:helix-turn-helix domain-containing protein [Heliobacterium mobile]MTV47741.1 hypothetical protein [Heliobacterium mobile]